MSCQYPPVREFLSSLETVAFSTLCVNSVFGIGQLFFETVYGVLCRAVIPYHVLSPYFIVEVFSAAELSRECGVDASTINMWRSGNRGIRERSGSVREVAAALLRLDTGGLITEHYAPYNSINGDDVAAVVAWLSGTPIPGLTGRTESAGSCHFRRVSCNSLTCFITYR